jgi:hypothetical protein
VIKRLVHKAVDGTVSIAPLVTFRIIFGGLMFVSMIRFALNGWIDKQYIEPSFHFKYFGFFWLPEPAAWAIYALFLIAALAALGIALGFRYRVSAVLFFVAFTYIELLDVSYYLNHYYFVSLVAFAMIFMPAHRMHSLDVRAGRIAPLAQVRAFYPNLIKFHLGLVYFFAGVAKLNADWLFEAMPLAIWLPAQSHLPLIGELLMWKETAYAFSWFGALYDLFIPFVLLSARWRPLAYTAVIAFHLLTWMFFQIGMFPFIMIGATLIFFSPRWHEALQRFISPGALTGQKTSAPSLVPRPLIAAAVLWIGFQCAFPFRYLLYPGNPYWTEQGYRFGWRVMLMEKAGYAQFVVHDQEGRILEVDNAQFLTEVQEKMLATQTDLMIQYAKYLKAHFEEEGMSVKAVTAQVHVTLNGRPSQLYIDPSADLSAIEDGWGHKSWILPLTPIKA